VWPGPLQPGRACRAVGDEQRHDRPLPAHDQSPRSDHEQIDHQTLPAPGFFEGDTVAHCGPTLKGEFARTLNLTDMHIGWVFTRTVRNNARTHILGALKAGVREIPYEVTGLDFDNGSEFLNRPVIKWAAQMEIFFTRSRPYKNNHLVRRYGFYYRYDTDAERVRPTVDHDPLTPSRIATGPPNGSLSVRL
jgi:IS30 family transposase